MKQFLHQFPVQDANNVTTNIKIIENGMNSQEVDFVTITITENKNIKNVALTFYLITYFKEL